MGDVVLTELLPGTCVVARRDTFRRLLRRAVSAEERPRALELAHALRVRGRSVTYSLRQQSVGKQFKMAAAQGARRVIVLGPAELERGMAVLRDMTSGEECDVDLEELVEDDR